MTFGEKVKEVRSRLYRRQVEFAKAIGASYPTINRWENKRFEPSYKAQKAFFEFCKSNGIHLEELGE